MTQDDIDRMTALPRLFKEVQWRIVGEIKAVDSPSGVAYRLAGWLISAGLNSRQMQTFLEYLNWSTSSGRGSLEEALNIIGREPRANGAARSIGEAVRAAAGRPEWRKPAAKCDGAKMPMGGIQEANTLRKPPKPLECLRKINAGVSCPYDIDVRSNTISYRGKCYQIPRGDASRVVNALVRGMLVGIRKKRKWLVRFTRNEEKILHRNGDGTQFYKDCVVRTELTGGGNQKFGGSAQLRA